MRHHAILDLQRGQCGMIYMHRSLALPPTLQREIPRLGEASLGNHHVGELGVV